MEQNGLKPLPCFPYGEDISMLKKYIDNYEYICQREENVNSNCLKCKYYKYCKGDCCAMEWDESSCPTPNKIFDIIKERNKSYE